MPVSRLFFSLVYLSLWHLTKSGIGSNRFVGRASIDLWLDFCSGGEEESPDASVENILNVLSGVDKDDFVYRIARYYSQVKLIISSLCSESACICCIFSPPIYILLAM